MKYILNVTNACNACCHYCFVDSNQEYINVDSFKEFILKRDFANDSVCISGGEPMLHKEIKEIISVCLQNFRQVEMNSNGSIDVPIFDDLLINISMDGINKCFEKLRITNNDIAVNLDVMIMKENVDVIDIELDRYIEYFKNIKSVGFIVIDDGNIEKYIFERTMEIANRILEMFNYQVKIKYNFTKSEVQNEIRYSVIEPNLEIKEFFFKKKKFREVYLYVMQN